jgi:hypothetical protein
VSAQTVWTFGEQHIGLRVHCSRQESENPTRLVRQYGSQPARQSGNERLGLTGRARAEQHRHVHGSMGTQSEDLGPTLAPRHWQKPRAPVAER